MYEEEEEVSRSFRQKKKFRGKRYGIKSSSNSFTVISFVRGFLCIPICVCPRTASNRLTGRWHMAKENYVSSRNKKVSKSKLTKKQLDKYFFMKRKKKFLHKWCQTNIVYRKNVQNNFICMLDEKKKSGRSSSSTRHYHEI